MKRVFCAAIVLGLSVQGLLAASPNTVSGSQTTKQPWEWTDAERLAGRFDPAFIKAIRHPRHDLAAGVVANEAKESDWTMGLNGDTNPELLLPFELFTNLLRGFNRDLQFRDARRMVLGASRLPSIIRR